MHARVVVAMLPLLAPGLLPAQELVWDRTGTLQSSQMAGQIAAIGDIDHDGYKDLLQIGMGVGATGFREWQLFFLSGRDGQMLRVRPHVLVPGANYTYWTIAATGDMDGDGVGGLRRHALGSGMLPQGHDRRGAQRQRRPADLERHQHLGQPVRVLAGRQPGCRWRRQAGSGGTAPEENQPNGAIYVFRNDGTLLAEDLGTQQLALGFYQGRGTLGSVGDLDRDGCDDYRRWSRDHIRPAVRQ